jgi:hypothetical protein
MKPAGSWRSTSNTSSPASSSCGDDVSCQDTTIQPIITHQHCFCYCQSHNFINTTATPVSRVNVLIPVGDLLIGDDTFWNFTSSLHSLTFVNGRIRDAGGLKQTPICPDSLFHNSRSLENRSLATRSQIIGRPPTSYYSLPTAR